MFVSIIKARYIGHILQSVNVDDYRYVRKLQDLHLFSLVILSVLAVIWYKTHYKDKDDPLNHDTTVVTK